MRLIINADDFGLSKSITDGIIEGIKGGYITSTSLMVNMPFAEYAVKEAIKNNISCVGLHSNLTVGKPIIENKNLTDDSGSFLYNRKQIDRTDLSYEDVYNEIKAQIKQVEKLSNGKLKIDHIDMHHHLFDNDNIKDAVLDIARELSLPIRNEGNVVDDIITPDVLYSDFTIKNVNLENLKHMLNKYKNQNVTVEVMTHPGYIDDYTKTITSYLDRDKELNILKQAKYDGLFDNIELISFSKLGK